MLKTYDYIIIGAGIGGLSAACFLSKYNKKVLVLEKNDKVGGLCTSFVKNDTQFDCGIEGLHELEPKETIPQFIEFLGGRIESEIKEENICCYINDKKYTFRYKSLKEDFFLQFPNDKEDIEKLFTASNGIIKQKTEIPGLFLVGQWTFPGFGIAGVMVSGYYLAKELLKKDAIDLQKEFIEYFK